ncbi:3-methyladenine DNA glycosylase [Gordonia sp. CPCC 205333]|uniref:3-methyladenine DNA glycosylase n=1 Tax=Gordonia sp. CPCC 205333 TaxID=3140790 RepID=UPI003AF3939A
MNSSTTDVPTLMSADSWRDAALRHRARVDELIGDYLAARRRGATHPVIDFLFTYYPYRPVLLQRWHPGFGVVLAEGPERSHPYAEQRGYERVDGGVTVSRAYLRKRSTTIAYTGELLSATASRPARLGCFGLHEWAMVYGAGSAASGPNVTGAGSAASGPNVTGAGSAASGPNVTGAGSAASGPNVTGAGSAASGPNVTGAGSAASGPNVTGGGSVAAPRHSVPLRLGAVGTDEVVESMSLQCTHYDAFRFFTEPAVGRNAAELTRASQVDREQPGCLHASMDLYRLAAKLMPLLDSDLLLRTFELAYAAREIDMRASPYDLRAYGYRPIAIETAAGRAEYVRAQTVVAEQGSRLRTELLHHISQLRSAMSHP